MTFFRSTAPPSYHPELPWPLHGIAYLVMAVAPLSAVLFVGLEFGGGIVGVGISLGVGVIVVLANGALFDHVVDELLARLQPIAVHRIPRLLINIIGFVWVIAVCALSMIASFAVLSRLGYLAS